MSDYKLWRERAEHYEALAEVHLLSYENSIETSLMIMQMQGCLVEMYSEMLKASEKTKTSPKYAATKQRLDFLNHNLKKLATVDDENKRLKFSLQRAVHIRGNLISQIRDLKTRLGAAV